jgi:M6 family metalloprotease-like protein
MNKKALWLLLTLFLSLRIMAQGEDFTILKGDCMPLADESTADGHRATHRALIPKTDWDREKIYKQMVILFTFSGDDSEFTMKNPQEYYQKLFNEKGFNLNLGPGCVADYFRDQSGGLCNIEFDIYGPVQVSSKSQPYDEPDEKTHNYGKAPMKEATQLVLEANPDVDYSQYDWNDDGTIEQVIYIHAGPPGNTANTLGHIWPNTSTFEVVTTPDGKKITRYSASGECWGKKADGTIVYCGIGTACHEYSHCLGLPDIYPTTSKDQGYSVCDEWDLMDGGNFTNWGWCPPNYTALERHLMGWLELTELNEAATITGMKPVSEGGTAYIVKHSDSEWLLLENRQQTAWDAGAPGKGLVIYHVNYDGSVWQGNSVNNDKTKRRFHLVHADNMDYDAWSAYIEEKKLNPYAADEWMNRRVLSTSPYPYISEDKETVNNELTDTSTPAATMFYPGTEGELLLAKPITNIQMTDDGLISFDFMGGTTGIRHLPIAGDNDASCLYNLQGQRINIPKPGNLYIVKKNNGTTYKYIK